MMLWSSVLLGLRVEALIEARHCAYSAIVVKWG